MIHLLKKIVTLTIMCALTLLVCKKSFAQNEYPENDGGRPDRIINAEDPVIEQDLPPLESGEPEE
jgi:hypothetical protein